MPHIEPNLTCALQLPDRGQRSPTIRLSDDVGAVVGSIPTSEPKPQIPLPDQTVEAISALDILEHVHDEQTWLAEFDRVLVPGGKLTVRAPLENTVAWLDALNIYRYLSDTIGRGEHPQESYPTGWHRHYAPHDLPAILKLAGFEIADSWGEGFPIGEIPLLAGLVVGNILLERPDTEHQLFGLRCRWQVGWQPRLPVSVAARLVVHATRARSGFDPDPNLDETDRPEQQAATPLE